MTTESEKAEMERLGVTEEIHSVYHYAGFKYHALKDALFYADLEQNKAKE